MSKKMVTIIATIVLIALVGLVILFVPSMFPKKNNNIEGTLEEIMEKLYTGIPEDTLPSSLVTFPVSGDDLEYYIGTSDIDYEEVIVSEPMMSSIAYSVALVRLKDGADIESAKEKIRTNVNPRKWQCVWVEDENVRVENRGNIILLVMSDDFADTIVDNFNKI